ncbi:MAG: divalent-cation tolerance protein CutA [Alphaproteobacteria bacterium]
MRLIYITCPDDETADRLAEIAVDGQLAACANILPGMRSVYRWQGKIERSAEVVLLLKTTPEAAPELIRQMAEFHLYEQPAILDLPADGEEGFLQWIEGEVVP